MKLSVDFSALKKAVGRIKKEPTVIEPVTNPTPQCIKNWTYANELKFKSGLLTYKDQLGYILPVSRLSEKQTAYIEPKALMDKRIETQYFHVAKCEYVKTLSTTVHKLFVSEHIAENVEACPDCLNLLNFKSGDQFEVEYKSRYFSLINSESHNLQDAQSDKPCACCMVDFSVELSHFIKPSTTPYTYHVVLENESLSLCADCYSKLAFQSPVVPIDERLLFAQNRQNIAYYRHHQRHGFNSLKDAEDDVVGVGIEVDSWATVYQLAENATLGVLERFERLFPQTPEIDYLLIDKASGEPRVLGHFHLAWPSSKIAIVIDKPHQKIDGWQILDLEQAMAELNKS